MFCCRAKLSWHKADNYRRRERSSDFRRWHFKKKKKERKSRRDICTFLLHGFAKKNQNKTVIVTRKNINMCHMLLYALLNFSVSRIMYYYVFFLTLHHVVWCYIMKINRLWPDCIVLWVNSSNNNSIAWDVNLENSTVTSKFITKLAAADKWVPLHTWLLCCQQFRGWSMLTANETCWTAPLEKETSSRRVISSSFYWGKNINTCASAPLETC